MTPQLSNKQKKCSTNLAAYINKSVYVIAKGNSLEDALDNNKKILPALKMLDSMKQLVAIFMDISNVSTILVSEKEQQATN
jgi:hypothetical protein